MSRIAAICVLSLLVCLAGAEETACTCADGNASYLFLHSPKKAPGDPDPCPAVRKGVHPPCPVPADPCGGKRMECFLRRHAESWRIACSLCAAGPCCPDTEQAEPGFRAAEAVKLAESQRALSGSKKLEVALSPHFVALTDIERMQIRTAKGGLRWADKHELLHVHLQRAEMARRDFEKTFGSAHDSRSALAFVSSDKVRAAIAKAYFGQTWTSLRRGYNSAGTIAGGTAQNGICTVGRKDDALSFRIRHWIGHLLMSTYCGASPMEKYLPRWLDMGCAHWLARQHPRARNFGYFCIQEGTSRGGGSKVSGSGSRWPEKAYRIAAQGPKRDPVEAMFAASTIKEMDYDMHIRAWSWFDIFTREEPKPFVQFVRQLRRGVEARTAAKAAWGQAPEIVDQRWRERVLRRRKDVTATVEEREKETEVGAARRSELASIRNERDLKLLANRIRGLERCRNIETAKLLVKLVDLRASDRVREVIALVLRATSDDEVLAYLRGKGCDKARDLGRATIFRALGEAGSEAAIPRLRAALESDTFWLARANAARALAQLKDHESIAALAKLGSSAPNGKVRVAALDGLAAFGGDAASAVPAIAGNLKNKAWQIKVATCEALARLGNDDAVEPLIERVDLEGGRVHDEIRRALKALTGMDRDWRSETWRKWWKREQRFRELEKASREALKREGKEAPPESDGRYAKKKKPPTYYGIKVFARTVGYVLDTSASMNQGFEVSPALESRLGRQYRERTRIGVSREELAHSIRELDPRTRLNLYFFNDRARAWQTVPVPAGTMRENAVGALRSAAATGQTNYYDALRLVLGLPETGGWSAAFADTPDTLCFLTDGLPTTGEITRGDELLSWFNERNRFARLRVHVIAMGRAGVDREFLVGFATGNGGTFVTLSGTH